MKYLPTILLILGIAVITTGVALLNVPAAFITGGCLTVAVAVLMMIGGNDEKRP